MIQTIYYTIIRPICTVKFDQTFTTHTNPYSTIITNFNIINHIDTIPCTTW